MKPFYISAAIALLLSAAGAAQTPTIRSTPDGVVNNASYAARGLPNSSIAQGSIFVIFGDNLGPAELATQPSYPLQTTLKGTAVAVTVGGSTVNAIPIYTVKGQVGAVLPSNTPAGEGTVRVTYNGQPSSTHAVTVVPNSFGVFTLNQKGSGPAAITDANGGYITLTTAAKPGQTVVVWGTGLGPIAADDAADQSGGDMKNVPVEVLIGGVPATIRYRGRSPHIAGLDQINVDIPSGLSGCYVSLVVTIGDMVSNSSTLPVAANGGACSDANGLAASDFAALTGKSSVSFGTISVGRTVNQSNISLPPGVTLPPGLGGTTKTDDASALFFRYTPQQLTASQGLFQQASIGSCIVTTFTSGAVTPVPDPILPVFLDAGPAITMSYPGGSMQMNRDAQYGIYSSPAGTTGQTFIPDAGGTFSFTNASGGQDVGAIQGASVNLAAPLVWTNMDQITDVTRGGQGGLQITWSGGAIGTYVEITGSSILLDTGSSSTIGDVSFSCTAPAAAHAFTVPRAVLLQLPGSASVDAGGFSIPTGSLAVGNYTQPARFTAPGLDFGFIIAYVSDSKSVNYK